MIRNEETFVLETVLVPEQVEMVNFPSKPLGIWNPAAYVKNDKLIIIPRLHFDTHFYVSSIGLCEPISLAELSSYHICKRKIKVSMLKYPETLIEIDGVEDPRITEDGTSLLTVGLNKKFNVSQTTLSKFDGRNAYDPKPFLYKGEELHTGRDAVLLNDHILFFRPEGRQLHTFKADYIETPTNVVLTNVGKESILPRAKGMKKTGFSTNAVKISDDEYLIAYHGVYLDKDEYREGFVLMDDEGKILSKTPLLLKTEGILQYAGGRPFTLFGCGLVLRKGVLFFVGGIADQLIGIYSAQIEDVLGAME